MNKRRDSSGRGKKQSIEVLTMNQKPEIGNREVREWIRCDGEGAITDQC